MRELVDKLEKRKKPSKILLSVRILGFLVLDGWGLLWKFLLVVQVSVDVSICDKTKKKKNKYKDKRFLQHSCRVALLRRASFVFVILITLIIEFTYRTLKYRL